MPMAISIGGILRSIESLTDKSVRAEQALANGLSRSSRQPETILETSTADGIWIKTVCVPDAETILPQHSHAWDHTSLICIGAVMVKAGEGDSWEEYRAPATVFIKAGIKHTFVTMQPYTVIACIHNLHGEQAVKVLEEHNLVGDV